METQNAEFKENLLLGYKLHKVWVVTLNTTSSLFWLFHEETILYRHTFDRIGQVRLTFFFGVVTLFSVANGVAILSFWIS